MKWFLKFKEATSSHVYDTLAFHISFCYSKIAQILDQFWVQQIFFLMVLAVISSNRNFKSFDSGHMFILLW